MEVNTSAPCRCGRSLDWRVLGYAPHPYKYNASVTCEACGINYAIEDGICAPASHRSFGQGNIKSSKGKGKEVSGSTKGGASEQYNYARWQLVRLKSRFVYNPLHGSEMEAPKYSGMLMVLGREWWVPFERRTACSICAEKFGVTRWRYNCVGCGEVVCTECSPKIVEVSGYPDKQRVCQECEHKPPSSFLPEWRERFFAIQSYFLYLRHRPVLEERAKGGMPLLELDTCEQVSDVTLKAETELDPPPAYAEFCFKAVFSSTDTVSIKYFCAKNQELMNSWIIALKESSKEKKEKRQQAKKVEKLNTQLVKACREVDGQNVKELLRQHADPAFIQDKKSGITPLMLCAMNYKPEATLCATLILQEGTPPNAQDCNGNTALHLSLQTGQGEDKVMDMLLRYGADLAVEETSGLTAYELAKARKLAVASAKIQKCEELNSGIELTTVGLRKMLERGRSINWRDSQGNSLLHYACMRTQVDPLRFLIENRVNINMGNLYGQAPLHVSSVSNFGEGIRLLLEYRANIDVQDNMGYTPLHVSVIFNLPDCVELLLNRGANPNIRSYPPSGSVSPLHLSACLGYEECAQKLLTKGSNPNLEDEMGQTPITIATRFDVHILPLLKQFTDLHKLFQWCKDPAKRPDIEQLLMNDKVLNDNVNWPNGEKMTMLHVATIAQNLPVVQILLANHANFDLADSYGNTPIDIANGTEKTPLNPPAKNEKIHQRFLQYRRITALNEFIRNGSLPDVKRLLKEAPTEYNLHVQDGMAPLHIAARQGYVAICKRLIKGGAKGDFLTVQGQTPVHLAAEKGRVDCLRMLLSDPVGKSVVNLGDDRGDTPLILCVKGSPDTLQGTCEVLLACGAEVEQKNRDGKSALDVSTATKSVAFKHVLTKHNNGVKVIDAARRGDSKTIDEIFQLNENEQAPADFQDMNGKTALHYACSSQEGETCVSILLRNGARVEIRDNEGKTPLDILKSRQHTEKTQRLLTQFAAGIQVSSCAFAGQKQRMQQSITKFDIDVDFCDQIEMKTPLHWACINGSRTCVDDLLTQGATVDVKDKNSESPLFLAVRCGHKDIIELLLERGANPEISNACGKKLIDSICDQSEAKDQLKQGLALYRILNLLNINIPIHEKEEVERALTDLFERLEYEITTLMPEITAILQKHINGRRFVEDFAGKGDLAHLREMYSQDSAIVNFKSAGETALHRAVKKGYIDMVEDLLEQGALVSITNTAKKTPVDIADELLAKHENTDTITKILELLHRYGCGPEIIDCCYVGKAEKLSSILAINIPLGFNTDYKFRGDFTALHVAAANGHLNCIEVLLKYNATPDKQDADGFTPLHYAARWGREKEVEKLLEVGVDVELRNDQGLTPIMMAAIGEHNKCLQILTSAGAHVNIQNNYKRTPLMLAVRSGFTECVQLLLEKGADPNLVDNSKNSALHYATINGHVEIMKLLVGAKNIDTNSENRMAHTPVIIATAKGNATLLSILLSSKVTNTNLGSKITALFVAIHYSNFECVKLLLEDNADPNKRVDGLAPLHRAVMVGDVTIIEMLLSYGADPLAEADFKIGNKQYQLSPLDLVQIAHEIGSKSVPPHLLRCKAGATKIREAITKGEITALKLLLEEYSNTEVVNYPDRNGQTPLHWACEKEYVSCVKAVLVYYPNLTLKDKNGNLPMDIAENNSNPEVKKELQSYENAVKLLKSAAEGHESQLKKIIADGDVDVEFTKPDKNTAVHLCAAYGYVGCLRLLLVTASHLASRMNADKQLPIHLAAERGHLNCVQELINITKPGGKALHEELWTLATKYDNQELIKWLHSDVCSHKELPKSLSPALIEIEYHFNELVNFLSDIRENISFYDLEKQLYNKLKRWVILEQKIQQGRTQIRDGEDLKKAISTAKAKTPKGGKTVVLFYCVQNLDNKPLAHPPSHSDNPSLSKPTVTAKLRTGEATTASVENPSTSTNDLSSPDQFNKLKEIIAEKFGPYQKELEKELKKLHMHIKLVSKQNSDIYDEIQNIKANDREFVSMN